MKSSLSLIFVNTLVVACIFKVGFFAVRHFNHLRPSENSPSMMVNTEPDSLFEISPKARKNLGIRSMPVKPTAYWRTLQIPGIIEDRTGLTDRGVTTPLAGVVTQVHAFEGDIIRPGEKLFTIRLVSEYLQVT